MILEHNNAYTVRINKTSQSPSLQALLRSLSSLLLAIIIARSSLTERIYSIEIIAERGPVYTGPLAEGEGFEPSEGRVLHRNYNPAQ